MSEIFNKRLYEVVLGNVNGAPCFVDAISGRRADIFPIGRRGFFSFNFLIPEKEVYSFRIENKGIANDRAPNHGEKVDAYMFVFSPIQEGVKKLVKPGIQYYRE